MIEDYRGKTTIDKVAERNDKVDALKKELKKIEKRFKSKLRKEKKEKLYKSISDKLSKCSEASAKAAIIGREKLIRQLIDKKQQGIPTNILSNPSLYFGKNKENKTRWL